jgi:hypothetical protein
MNRIGISLGARVAEAMKLSNYNIENPRTRGWGLSWCRRIVDKANDWESDPLIDLLTVGILRIDPEQRLPAGECLKKGNELGLFNGHTFDTGSTTPKQQTDPQGEISDDDDSITIILGSLWSRAEIISHEDNCRTKSGSPRHASEPSDQWVGKSSQAPVVSRITQIQRASTTIKKRDQ